MPCIKVAQGLLLYGRQIRDGAMDRKSFLAQIGVKDNAFRDAGEHLGAVRIKRGAAFFDSSKRGQLHFGPGAGLVMGVSLGRGSLRAALVDANGELHYRTEATPLPGQLELEPDELLDRIRDVVGPVFSAALSPDNRLLVDGKLPLLGVAVAWGVPVGRDGKPLGPALRHDSWRDKAPLYQRVAGHLRIPADRSHAMNDSHAAAIAVAWQQTRADEHLHQPHARLGIVLRVAGGISGASIVVEPPKAKPGLGLVSGFLKSVLIGGNDYHAGELGHLPLDGEIIELLNRDRPEGLRPLVAHRCSCTTSETPPNHLEAYAATPALMHRILTEVPMSHAEECESVRGVISNPRTPVNNRALKDVGVLVGRALLGPVAMLNPATITLTGSLAVPVVQAALDDYLASASGLGAAPKLTPLTDARTNKFIRVQGAALAVLRNNVHRRFETLLGGAKDNAGPRVAQLTLPLSDLPWRR